MQDESCETDLLSRVAHDGRQACPTFGDEEDTQKNRRTRMRDLDGKMSDGSMRGDDVCWPAMTVLGGPGDPTFWTFFKPPSTFANYRKQPPTVPSFGKRRWLVLWLGDVIDDFYGAVWHGG